VVLPICILVLALVVLPGCRAVNEGMFYDDMKEAFPRFRVARADYSESPGFMGEGGGVTVTFELESVDVPGFRLEGLYYVLDDPSRESQMQVYRRTIFSGKVISRSSVTNFERLWLSLRLPPIGVSRDV
jgi:hypothetical protein